MCVDMALSLDDAVASFCDTFVQRPTAGEKATSVSDFGKASAFQATLRALAALEDGVSQGVEKRYGKLVYESCKIVMTSCAIDLFAPGGLEALFGENGQLECVESLLMSQVQALGATSDSIVSSVLVSIGHGLAIGNWMGLVEAVAPQFAADKDSGLSKLQRIVGQEGKSVLFACQDVVFKGMSPDLLDMARNIVAIVDKMADCMAPDTHAVSCHDEVLSFPFVLAGLTSKLPKELHSSLKALLFKQHQSRDGPRNDVLQCVVSLLSLLGKTNDELSDFCAIAESLFATRHRARAFAGRDVDTQWSTVFEAFKSRPPLSTVLTHKMQNIAQAPAASPEQEAAAKKFIGCLNGLSSFDFDADVTKFFDKCVELCSELLEDQLDAEKPSLSVLRGLLKSCHPIGSKSADKLDSRMLMSKVFKLVISATGQKDTLKPMKKAALLYFEKRGSEAALGIWRALSEFSLACSPALLSESERDVAVARCDCLLKAAEVFPMPLHARLAELIEAELPDHGCKKQICEKFRSIASPDCSAKVVQDMFEEAIDCVQASCAGNDSELMLMCSVRRCFKKACAERMHGLRLSLAAVYDKPAVLEIEKVMKSASVHEIHTRKLEAAKAVELAWNTLGEIRGLPCSLRATAEAGKKLLSLRNRVLTGQQVFEALGAWRQISSKTSVSWLVQMLQGVVMRCMAADGGSDVMRVSGLVLSFAAVHSMVRIGRDKLILLEEKGSETFLKMLPPTFREVAANSLAGHAENLTGSSGGGPQPGRGASNALASPLQTAAPPLNLDAIEHFKKLSRDGSRNITAQLERIKKSLFPSSDVVSLWSSTKLLPELFNAVVLIRSSADQWIQSCSHMSRITQVQHAEQKDVAEVAEALFKAGLLLMRLMNAILVMGQPFSLRDQCAFEKVETLLGTVTDIMSTLSAELKDKAVMDYLSAMKKSKHAGKGNKRIDLFQMPSKDTYGPGQERRQKVNTQDYSKTGLDRYVYHTEEQIMHSQDHEFAEEEAVEKGSINFTVQRSEDAGGLSTEELHSVDIDPDLQWLDPSASSSVTKTMISGASKLGPGKSDSRWHAKKGVSKGKTTLSLAGKQQHQNDPLNREQRGDFNLDGKVEVKLQAEQGEKVKVDIQIDKAMMRRQMENANIAEIYKEMAPRRMRDAMPVGDPLSCRINPDEKDKRWTYQRLVECKPVASMIERVLWDLRETIPAFFQKAQDPYQFEFLICVDNSGSMGTKETAVIESLVVLLEVLRKLEFRFAVSLWGREPGKLLHDFDRDDFSRPEHEHKEVSEPFNLKKGQHILQSLTFDEPSRIASCLNSMCERVWPDKKPPNVKRLVITVFDGFSEECTTENLAPLPNKFECDIGMLLIDDNKKPDIEEILKPVCPKGCLRILDKTQVDMLPPQLVLLLKAMFEHSKKSLLNMEQNVSTPSEDIQRAEVLAPKKDDLKSKETLLDMVAFELSDKDTLLQNSDRGVGGGRSMFSLSKPDITIPGLAGAREDQRLVEAVNRSDPNRVEACLKLHAEFYQELEQDMISNSSLRNSTQEYWENTIKELSAPIEEYTTVLEEAVMPFNKYTRRRCTLKGSSLHLPGLVKAVISNFTYKKFFSQKTAGGKRNYSVCLALDVSASMNGHLGHCAQETLICLIAALQEMRVDFSIVFFGQCVRIIKTIDQVWGPAVLWTLMNYRASKDTMTMDADGIEVALQLVRQRGDAERKVFVLTDGYGTCGGRLPLILDAAERQGTDVVAIGVGADRKHVKQVYSRYISALLPAVVPQGLRALYLAESIPDEDDQMIVRSSREGTVAEVLENPTALKMLQADMRREREANLVRGDRPDVITVDVAFCLDCTGSMSAWIAAAKGQILTITEDIVPKIQEKYPGMQIEIKFSLVGFRDYGDSEQMVCFPDDYSFSDDKEAFKAHLQSLVAKGGGDGPEDLLGALDIAGTQLKWESRMKYLVIITDAPAHGHDCNNDANDRHKDGDPKGLTMKKVMEPLGQKKIDIMFCRVKKTNTAKTEEQMKKHYNSDKAGETRAMLTIDLFDADTIETGRFHFVFCLDESGSMSGPPWQALMSAYRTFINKRRNDQGMGDFVSTVTFASSHTAQGIMVPIDRVSLEISRHGGGTNFDAAMIGAGQALQQTPPGVTPMLIFMSDGQGGGNPVPTIQNFRQQYPGFVCHCVGLGGGCDMATLRCMSDAGGGQSHATEIHTIAGAFGQIAAGCAAMDGMVAKFGEEIAKMVATRICIDHM